jgi:hypothetical protein
MPKAVPIQTNFTAGELSPRLEGRVDLAKYFNGARTMLNMFVHPHGGATRRGGTEYINTVKTVAKSTRLIPFEFSTTQAYMLEFGENYIRFYRNQARIEANGTISAISKANPGQVTQTAHGLTTGDTLTFENVGGMTELNGNNYTITKVDADNYTIGVDTTSFTTFTSGGDAIIEITTTYAESELFEIQFVQSADTLYLVHPNHEPATLTRTTHTSWALADISFTAEPAEWGAANYPGSVAFFEQRLWFAGNPDNPQTLWGSKSGDFDNMTTGTSADDAVVYTISTDQVNKIQWLSPGKVLVVGTAGGEFIVSASSLEEAITPSNIRIVRQSTFGSDYQLPARVSSLVLFVQRSKRKIREFVFNFQSDSYVAPDLTILSEHITEGGLEQLTYQQEPDSVLWAARNDGTLIGLTYQRDQEVVGWHRHILGGDSDANGTQAKVESVATIPTQDGSRNELWMVVLRYIDGSATRYIEVLNKGLLPEDDQEDAFFVDSGLTYSGAATSTVTGLDHLEGETVSILADGSVRPNETVSSGSITVDGPQFTKAAVGIAFNSDLETLRFEAGSADGTAQGKTKRISSATVRLYRTIGLLVGPDADNLDREPFRDSSMAMDEPVALFTGDKEIPFPKGWNKDGRVYIRQNQPLPMTVLAIIPRIKTNN